MKILLSPGQSLDIAVEGIGILYTVVVWPASVHGDVDVEVVDQSNAAILDQNTHEVVGRLMT